MNRRIPIDELKQKLNERLPEILHSILTDVTRRGAGRYKGFAPNGDIVVVDWEEVLNTTGSGQGNGNLFNLILALHCNNNMFEACRFCERILGLSPDTWQPDPERAERDRLARRAAAEARERNREANRKIWQRLYQIGNRQTPESLSGRYLMGRGCPLSPYLRDGRSPYDDGPVMLAPMLSLETLGMRAIHATKLRECDGLVTKSLRVPAKQTWGYPSNCVVTLADGVSGLSLKQAWFERLEEPLILSEGIENGLSVHSEFPHLRLFAAGSIGNLGNLVLPPWFRLIVLVRDHENPENLGPAGVRARVIEQWLREGRRVELIDPPAGFKDVNDAIRSFVAF